MICVLWNEEIKGDVVNGIALAYGNNPHPLADEGQCCDECNMFKVIPARMERSYVDPIKCVEKKQKWNRLKFYCLLPCCWDARKKSQLKPHHHNATVVSLLTME